MPLAHAIRGIAFGVVALLLGACASGLSIPSIPTRAEFMRTPEVIRRGAAETAIVRVEDTVTRTEVAAAVQSLIAAGEICYPWPAIWLDGRDRRGVFLARFDLMSRDWGADVTSPRQQRMQEFVDLGFLTATERPEIGPGVVEYALTPDGVAFLRGSPYGGSRPRFCPNSQRRLVDITDMQFGEFACGNLHVRFTHVADGWPTWARTSAARERVDSTWAPPGVPLNGEVTLSRQWFAQDILPPGVENGAMRSLCLDSSRENVIGDDLNLNAP